MPSRMQPPFSVVSLFTGAGGLDLGIEASGGATRVAVEIDSDAAATLRLNRDWPVIEQDIHSPQAASDRILAAASAKVGDVDLLVGGPPCQPFSKSGYWARGDSRRLADPRATTLEAYLRVLRDIQPRAFILENVPGLAFQAKSEGLDLLRTTIQSINTEVGTWYSFEVGLLRAVEFGVPQDRQRVFIVGSRDGTRFTFPSPTHTRPGFDPATSPSQLETPGLRTEAPEREPFLTAWDAIGELQEDDDPGLQVGGKWAELLCTIPEGRNYLYHTDRGEGLPLFGWRRRYWSFLLKLAKDLPSWTLTADPGSAIGPFHWKNRRLSAQEMMRLQTFPLKYKLAGNRRSVQRQLGNAVPSALAELLGREVAKQLLGRSDVAGRTPTLLPLRQGPPPAAETPAPVPQRYTSLVGEYTPHPGTGLGFAAVRRRA
jgi:DNA (cytosine-5)-methyltransferase 1